ncbi:MAG TPA: phage tail protein [Longimicrobiaceae bacterium]|nr:phage tail protein [Longimicrobiaceae bacterium]
MTATATLPDRVPPVPGPPHDSTWHRLDARAGWRAATLDGLEREPDRWALTLVRAPGVRRRLDEASGSLGGLVPPGNVALGGEGSVYLLHLERGRLLRFDGCACAFQEVPCFGGRGGGVRELLDPRGIETDLMSLYVADAGEAESGGRVVVVALPEMAIRALWTLPPDPERGRAQPWRPVAVAADGRGAIWVADPANARVHRFDRLGRLRGSVAGMGGVRHLAVDCRGRVYAVLDGETEARVIEPGGGTPGRASDPEPLRPRFPRLPFAVDRDGRMELGPLCPRGGPAWFDLSGEPATPIDPASEAQFGASGLYLSEPLDSRIHRCQWHRVVVRAEVPEGTRLSIATWSAEAPPPASEVASLPETAWATQLSVAPGKTGEWDGLVRSGPGRYLWLRLRFAGSGAATPRLHSVNVEFPRVSLRRYLPAVWSEDALSADFADRFLAVFDAGFREVERRLDTQAALYDPMSTPAAFLPWLASWIGASLGRQWPERTRREFLERAAGFYRQQGTPGGLRAQLLFFLGMEGSGERGGCPAEAPRPARCEPRPGPCGELVAERRAWEPPPLILEHYRLRRWLFLGAGRLGDDAVLWGQRIVNRSQLLAAGPAERGAQVGVTRLITTPDPLRDPFHVYAHRFTVFVPAARACTPERRRALEGVVGAAAPAHTRWHVEYVEPRFRIGFQSMIGLDSVVGQYPRGVTLGGTSLGPASVLGAGPPDAPPRPRIGSTSRL